MCAEVLDRALKTAELEGRLNGIKVAPNAPAITHLLFADDSLFFCQAKNEEVQCIMGILDDYNKASGQKVSSAKSTLVFGKMIPEVVREDIKQIFGITVEGGKGMYLGLPEMVGRSRMESFKFITGKVDNRINSWKHKFLSLAGKQVLLKSVVLAMPTHSMSVFKMPLKLINQIESSMAAFWWRNKDTGKGIHWKAWKKLCKPKDDGGLGFRDLEGFNVALLGKQLWRMLNQPDTLMAKVFKGRYFPKCSPLEAKLGDRPSYAWRSIHGAQGLIRLGARIEFGNGNSVKFFSDPWLNTKPPRPPLPKDDVETDDLPVEFFKDPTSDEWKLPRLSDVFPEEEVKLITQIRPTTTQASHNASWIFNSNGDYSVKSGYWLWTQHFQSREDGDPVGSFGPSLAPLFQAIWKSDTVPKIQHHLWKCLSESMVVMANLAKRKLKVSAICPRCGDEDETVNHLLFQCPYAKLVWAVSPLASLYYPLSSPSLYQNMATGLVPDDLTKERLGTQLELWPWILWRLWKGQNLFCFQGVDVNAQEIVDQAMADAKEWCDTKEETLIHTKSSKTTSSSASLAWLPPPSDFLKCNVDATWKQDGDRCGTGWILRDSEGNMLWYGAKCYPALISSLEVEAAALLWAMTCLDNMGKRDVIFETDCSNLVDALENPRQWPRLAHFVTEALKQWRCLRPRFCAVKRDRNLIADSIANHISNCPIYEAVLDCTLPAWLRHLVLKDMPVSQ